LSVHGIDSRVRVILAKDGDPGLEGECSRGKGRNGYGVRIGRRRAASRGVKEVTSGRIHATRSENRLLLHTVGCDRSNLREHVLPRVIDSPASTEDRFLIVENVPGKTESELEHFLLIRQEPRGREAWIGKFHTISGIRRRDR